MIEYTNYFTKQPLYSIILALKLKNIGNSSFVNKNTK